jgi:hypothetical protein
VSSILNKLFPSSEPRSGGSYTVDDRDLVQPLTEFPQSSVGAPLPVVLASEQSLFVAFYVERRDPDWDGTTCKVVSPDTDDQTVAVARFECAIAHFFGPPNDEAFSGHPLAKRGLSPYGAFEVLSSSWIRTLERMNSVHPFHRPEPFAFCRHFILTFHDSIFECVARRFSIDQPAGTLRSIVARLAESL